MLFYRLPRVLGSNYCIFRVSPRVGLIIPHLTTFRHSYISDLRVEVDSFRLQPQKTQTKQQVRINYQPEACRSDSTETPS